MSRNKNKNRNRHKEPTPPLTETEVNGTESQPKGETAQHKSMQAIDTAKAVEPEKKINPQATVQDYNPGKVGSNVKGRKAAKEVLDKAQEAAKDVLELAMTEPEYKDKLTPAFWEYLRDEAIKRVGMPLMHTTEAKVMSEKNAKNFEKTKFESGRHQGKTTKNVYEKDREYFLEFASKPDLFQREMRRYHAYRQATLHAKPPVKQGAKKP